MGLTAGSAVAVLFFVAAALYASVGHAGASGYLAVMALFGMAPAAMKPTALVLNLLVAAVGTVKFYRAGFFSWALFWPFAAASIPLAFVGGRLTLDTTVYRVVVGAVLLYAAVRMYLSARRSGEVAVRVPPLAAALLWGGVIGLLSGLTGVGGGIFLSPLILLMGWAGPRETSGVSALFILVNSAAGLLGHLSSVANLPPLLPLWAAAAVAGGWIGAEYGSRHLATPVLRRLLAVVLLIAGAKLILT